MTTEYSISPHGEKFQLPGPDDYGKEFEGLKALTHRGGVGSSFLTNMLGSKIQKGEGRKYENISRGHG